MPNVTRSLFISYRSSDAPKVDKIARDLALLRFDDGTPRFTTWQDKHNLPPASPNWWDAIVDAIIACEVFVFNLSRASLQSEVCRAELDYAHKRNRPIVPLVLDGEFFLNSQSGKYDLPKETWALVPDWLGQAQFLFYTGAEFYSKFQTALDLFERNWPRDVYAPPPLNPDGKSVHGSNHALYAAACDYAERLAFADAEKHFDALVRRNDADYVDFAAVWLELIRLYAELIEMVDHRSPPAILKRKWGAYAARFPNDVVESIFDPKGLAARLTAAPAVGTPFEVSVAPAQPPTVGTPLGVSAPPANPTPPADRASPVPTKPAPKPTQPAVGTPLAVSVLPAPFAWVDIPAVSVTVKSKTENVPAFKIAKYPLTNAQYKLFVDAGGYREKRWWTAAGWEAKLKGWVWKDGNYVETNQSWTEPRYWQDAKWNTPEQPVVGVSWYEGIAFCQWLSEQTGEKIMLPTEQQWQFAAQGKEGRVYPWGNEWDGTRCNNSVKPQDSNVTTPVRQFEGKGDSPFGVVDMAGNMWEWCLTDYEQGTHDINSNATYRVLRGGSWLYSVTDFFRCDYRNGNGPHDWYVSGGLRLALS